MKQRQGGEKLSELIGRFVAAGREKRHIPKTTERLAVGYAEARDQSKKEKRNAT